MSIQIGATMVPCRRCKAAPSEDCRVTDEEVKGQPLSLQVGRTRNDPHKIRERDARRMSELLEW